MTGIGETQLLFIDGQWSPGESLREVFDRWTGDHLADVAVASSDHALIAVDAAVRASEHPLAAHRRAAILAATAEEVQSSHELFARAIQRETGKPISAARTEVSRAIGTLRFSAEEAGRLPAEAVQLDAVESGVGTIAYTVPQPRGVVAAITPFNFPLNLVAHKLGPALAAGCPVVFKPSDKAEIVAGLLVSAFEAAGLPGGWLNLVTGPPESIVGAWIDDPRVEVVTFTGSARVGWALKAASPRKLHILELGSNTALYVHADADVQSAIDASVQAALANSGQACISLQRLYVHDSVAESFLAGLVEAVAGVEFGDPREERTIVGPLVTDDATSRLIGWIDSARAAGATVHTGGVATNGVLEPTVLSGVSPEHPLVCEEAFGPVVTVIPVGSLDDAIAGINRSEFGLNASIYTSALSVALDFTARVQAGSVLVNMPPSYRADQMPYGGVKGSGQGREGVKYAVEELVQQKLVVLRG
jgi:acyl-CoA reductase-like NAD-dependent aldehyde dehydrogenase